MVLGGDFGFSTDDAAVDDWRLPPTTATRPMAIPTMTSALRRHALVRLLAVAPRDLRDMAWF